MLQGIAEIRAQIKESKWPIAKLKS
jgi:hypothetical protein